MVLSEPEGNIEILEVSGGMNAYILKLLPPSPNCFDSDLGDFLLLFDRYPYVQVESSCTAVPPPPHFPLVLTSCRNSDIFKVSPVSPPPPQVSLCP